MAVNQKLISFKVDVDYLERLDHLVSRCDGRLAFNGRPVRINRNKLLNFAVDFICSSLELQLSVLDNHHISNKMPNLIDQI